jgi:hypothetical protein
VFDRKDSTNFFAGYLHGYILDPTMAISFPGASRRIHSYWVQHAPDGCIEYFLLAKYPCVATENSEKIESQLQMKW